MKSFTSFLKCLTVMALSLSSKDVLSLKAQYSKWEAEAKPTLTKFSMLREFSKVSKIFIQSGMEFTESEGLILANLFKSKLTSINSDISIPQDFMLLFKDISLFFRKDSEPAWKRINTRSKILNESILLKYFLDEDQDSAVGDLATQQAMEKIVFKLTGEKNDPILTLNEIKEFRETDQKLIERYAELRKVFVANYKKCLIKFLRMNGRPYMNVTVVANYLKAMGCNNIPKGFVGNIDEDGVLYTTAGKRLAGMLIGEVTMNSAYNAKTDDTYYCSLTVNKNQALRTVDFLTANKTKRFEVVYDLIDNVDKYRAVWTKDLKSPDVNNEVAATIVETIFQTYARIGGDKNENDGKPTYGIATLRVNHLHFSATGLDFEYPGKKGTMQYHSIRPTTPVNRQVIANIKSLVKSKRATDYVFTVRGRAITPSEVNKYLKERVGVPPKTTVHKFRHVVGTKMAMKLFAAAPFKKGQCTQANVEKWVKTECVKVGEALHHRSGSGDKQKTTGTTAIAAYISPDVVKDFFTDLGLRIPKWVPKTDT